jgi:ATP-dependent exoDNAse (exonuclease V) beta subunit
MRDRLRAALNREIAAAPAGRRPHWVHQRRLLDRAQIATIHSFCLQVLREFAFEAGLDPEFTVLENSRDFVGDTRRDTLLNLLTRDDPDLLELLAFYPWLSQGRSKGIDALVALIQAHARTYGCQVRPGRDRPIDFSACRDQLAAALQLIEELDRASQLNRDKDYYLAIRDFREALQRALGAGGPMRSG